MDALRRLVRGALGTNSALYQLAATSADFLSTVSNDGIKTWRSLEAIRNGRPGESTRSISLKNLLHPIQLRPGTRDVGTIVDNVIRREYGRFAPKREPKWMIDAGAYIGDTTAYFLSRFKGLKSIALEPNPESHEIAKRNLQPYQDRAVLLKKGLYSNEQIQRFGGTETGASIGTSGFEIECTTVPSLLKAFSIPYVDILKMDIEGAEEAVFSSNPQAWLGNVGVLLIEIHGDPIEALISRVLSENGFSMKRYRSIWYCERQDS